MKTMEMTVPAMTMVKKFSGRDAAKEYAQRMLGVHQTSWNDMDNVSTWGPLGSGMSVVRITRTVNNNAKLRWDPTAFPAAPKMIGM